MGKKIRFAHLADLHLGGWRERILTNLNFETFQKSIDMIIELKPDFALFAGDIFNNAMPPIELVEKVVVELMKLKKCDIPLYIIGGSHDYSNSGKSYLTLLEKAGMFVDVCKFDYVDRNKINLKFTKDACGAVLCGVLGKKNGLDKNIYINLNANTLSKDNFNIFLFHTTLNDFKPEFLKNVNSDAVMSYLPSGFDYYAGGHVHTHMEGEYGSGILSYPGPLFPNNFSELKRETPSFNMCEFDFETRKTKIERIFLKTYEKEHVRIEIDNLNPIDARIMIEKELSKRNFRNKILLLEISGVVDGKISDLKLSEIVSFCYEKGALIILKNAYKLTSSELKLYNVDIGKDSKSIEDDVISQVLDGEENKQELVKILKQMLSLDLVKQEEEKNSQYESRVYEALCKSLNI